MDVTKKIIGITLGIKFAKSFRIPDIAGEIIDTLLYKDKSPFNPKLFPRVQESSSRERVLHNPETTEYLRINTDDIILGIVVDNNFEERLKWIQEEVFTYFKDELFVKYKIKNIRRLGIIFDHKISKYDEVREAVNALTKNSVSGVENVNISFSKKMAAAEALYRKNVNDYKNAIYSFIEEGEDILTRLDFQYYYDPMIEDLRECFGENFFNDANTFLTGDYHNWLLKNHGEEEKS